MIVANSIGRGVVVPVVGNNVRHNPCPSTKRGIARRAAKAKPGPCNK